MVAVAALALVAAACADLSWQRPETDAATAEADRAECQRIALKQAGRLNESPFLVPYFVTARDNRGRVRNIPVVPFQQFGPPVWWPYAPTLAMDRQALKYDLFRDCLAAKGYELLPTEEDAEKKPEAQSGDDGDGPMGQPAEDQAPLVPQASPPPS